MTAQVKKTELKISFLLEHALNDTSAITFACSFNIYDDPSFSNSYFTYSGTASSVNLLQSLI
jgi:hypothetical protein